MDPKIRQQTFTVFFILYTLVVGVFVMRAELSIQAVDGVSFQSDIEALDTAKLEKIEKQLTNRTRFGEATAATPSASVEYGKAEPFR